MLTLNFDTYAAWFIAREIESASNFPQAFRSTIDAWEESEPWTREDDDFWEELADSLIRDSRDEMVPNAESLIELTDRAAELAEEGQVDGEGFYTPSRLEQDVQGWHEDDRLTSLLAKAYKAQWEFQVEVMKSHDEAVKAQRSQQ